MSDDRVATVESMHTKSEANSGAPILETGQPTSALDLDDGGLQSDSNLVSNTYGYIYQCIDATIFSCT